jgi:hypothetical protein
MVADCVRDTRVARQLSVAIACHWVDQPFTARSTAAKASPAKGRPVATKSRWIWPRRSGLHTVSAAAPASLHGASPRRVPTRTRPAMARAAEARIPATAARRRIAIARSRAWMSAAMDGQRSDGSAASPRPTTRSRAARSPRAVLRGGPALIAADSPAMSSAGNGRLPASASHSATQYEN